MSGIKTAIDVGFGSFGRLIYHNRFKTLFLMLGIIGSLATQLPSITFDTSTESFFHPEDPALIDYNTFKDQFGQDELVVIAIDPPNVFDNQFLTKLKAFHETLESEVPYLEEVSSLVNVRSTRGEADELIVDDLISKIPETREEMAVLKQRTLSSNFYPNLYISEDGRFTTLILKTLAYSPEENNEDMLGGFDSDDLKAPLESVDRTPLTDAEYTAMVIAVKDVMARFEAPDFPLHLAGSPVVNNEQKRGMQRDMARFIALAMVAIGFFLYLLFHRVSGVVLPLAVVGLSLIATIGVIAALGVTLKMPLMILPSFLLAVSVGAVVHLLAIFFRSYNNGAGKEDAIAHAMSHSGWPILMTGLTTAGGLMSFSTANMIAIADLGVFSGIGVLISLVFTLILVPALLAVIPLRKRGSGAGMTATSRFDAVMDRILVGFGEFAIRHRWSVVVVSAVITVVSVAGISSLRFSHNSLVWFPSTADVRLSTELIDREMSGSVTVELVIDTGRENGLYEPSILNRMEELANYAKAYRDKNGNQFVGKTNSLVEIIKEIHQALNENRPEFYAIPQDKDLIAQELLLFENSGSDDLEPIVDSLFSKARITVKVPWDDAAAYVSFVSAMQVEAEKIFGNDAKVTATGLLKLLTESIHLLMQSMVESYGIAIAVITVLMILLIGRLGMGLLSMIPNIAPISITLGLMGWLDIPLDMFTMLIGSIALGLAVDDTIHFFHNFLRYRRETGDTKAAVRETMLSSGRAIVFTTLVLVTGFWLFMFASMNNLFYFGLLTGFTLVVTLLANILLAPAMLALVLGSGKTQR